MHILGRKLSGFLQKQLTVELSWDSRQAGILFLSNSDDIEVKFAGFSELRILKILFCDKIILFLMGAEKS